MLGFFTRFTVSLENNYIFPTNFVDNYKKKFLEFGLLVLDSNCDCGTTPVVQEAG